MNQSFQRYSAAELETLRRVRAENPNMSWMQIRETYFPGRSTESIKLACRKHFPELIGRNGRGRLPATGGPRKALSGWDDESEGTRFLDMSEGGADALGAAIEGWFAKMDDETAREWRYALLTGRAAPQRRIEA